MDFTFAEIDVLIAKGMLPKDKINTFGISSADKGDNYRSHHVRKNDDGSISESWYYPVNVDCDDGSYDTRHFSAEYHTFADFVANKPYKENNYKD